MKCMSNLNREKIEAELQTVQAQLSSLALQQKENLIEDSVNERIFALEQEQQSLQLEIDQCLEQRAALLMEKSSY